MWSDRYLRDVNNGKQEPVYDGVKGGEPYIKRVFVASFCGKCKILGVTNNITPRDLVVVDDSYNDGLPSYLDEHTHVVHWDTGVQFKDDDEMIRRRIRIAKLMLHTESLVPPDENILFLDSDVEILEYNPYFHFFMGIRTPITFVIKAVIKPYLYIDNFSSSTNIYVPSMYRHQLRSVLISYLSLKHKPEVDIFINNALHSRPRRVPGVCHYIGNDLYCT